MQGDRSKILIDSIKRLLRRDATPHLRKIVNKTHAADLSVVFRSLSVYNQRKLFEMIEDMEQKGVLFSELDEDTFMAACSFSALLVASCPQNSHYIGTDQTRPDQDLM